MFSTKEREDVRRWIHSWTRREAFLRGSEPRQAGSDGRGLGAGGGVGRCSGGGSSKTCAEPIRSLFSLNDMEGERERRERGRDYPNFGGFCFLFFVFLLFRAAPVAYGSSQARGQIGAQLLVCATATAPPDLSCNLHHNSHQRRILNLLSVARNRTCILMDTGQVRYRWDMTGMNSKQILISRNPALIFKQNQKELLMSFIMLYLPVHFFLLCGKTAGGFVDSLDPFIMETVSVQGNYLIFFFWKFIPFYFLCFLYLDLCWTLDFWIRVFTFCCMMLSLVLLTYFILLSGFFF